MFFPTYFPINFFHSSSWYQITKSSIFYYECFKWPMFLRFPLQIDIFMHWSILGTIWCFSFCSFHFTFSYFIDLVVCEYIVVQFSHSFNWNVVSFHHILLFFLGNPKQKSHSWWQTIQQDWAVQPQSNQQQRQRRRQRWWW